MGVFESWVFIVLVVFSFLAELTPAQQLACNSNDLQALTGFYSYTQSGLLRWDVSNSSSDCCEWEGVTCSLSSSLGLSNETANSSRVTRLELSGKKLSGNISDSLGALDQLRVLNLSSNSFHGSLPLSLFTLPKLEVLNLSSNYLAGLMPLSYSLPEIQTLDLSQNGLNGSIPSGICDNSSKIQILNLDVNYFSGGIPPGLGNCTSLEQLNLATNDLSGPLGDDLFRLGNLTRLSLQQNSFSGQLGRGIGDLSSLARLDISQNMFLGEIPDVFSGLTKLVHFAVYSNGFSGSIPSSLSNSSSLNMLNLRNNSFFGQIVLNCEAMTNLNSLDLGTNFFNGSVPDNLPSCHQLKNINLARNNFTGGIPESFKDFHSLSYLSLSNSSIQNISSALQILNQCKNLTTLVLTLNFQGETLPADSDLSFKKLKVLIIASCKLYGSVPFWLRQSNQLQLLDLSWNHLSGSIPGWFGEFQSLFYLDLSNNSFTGEIPKNLTGLQSLITGNISLEEPSPDFPFFMKTNQSARGLQYNQVWSFPPRIDFSYNNLSGSIWPEFGNLRNLHYFDLNNNGLSGSIPSNLSEMTSLETLDLSHNLLSGTIPSSLVALTFLSKFSVAYNKLSGEIPSGGQFATFPNSSFEGNMGLCGEHFTTPCKVIEKNTTATAAKARRSKGATIGMAVGIGLGSLFLISLLFIILLRARYRRVVDPEKEEKIGHSRHLEEIGSKSVVLFEDKGRNEELSLDDLLVFTDSFDQANIIGCGGFGLVYKAVLPDGRKVAIKRLTGDCGQMEREFQAEVEALSRAQHPNLVVLQGYCMYRNDKLLIYSYMENSSLDYWLHEKNDGASCLDWDTRLQIAQGAARGLAYLHHSCNPHILHRDVKSSNILLDENFVAHLADFGLARLIDPYQTHVSTDLVGTLGYIPPEYGQASVATYKGDIYSFGVVLLELLTGHRPMDMCKPKESRNLISWVLQMKKEKRETEVFDPFIYDKQYHDEMLRVLDIACHCLNEYPKLRPSTQQLVSALDDIELSSLKEFRVASNPDKFMAMERSSVHTYSHIFSSESSPSLSFNSQGITEREIEL